MPKRRYLDEPDNPPSWFSSFGLNAAIADNPAYMQAIGWQQDREGNYHQDPTNKGAKELSKALFDIGINAATDVFLVPGIGKVGRTIANSKRVNSLLDRTAEALVRQGDNLQYPRAWNRKGMFNYIVKGGKNPELAYKAGPYSGEIATDISDKTRVVFNNTDVVPHKGDVVDGFFGKGYQLKSRNTRRIPYGLKGYISKYYPSIMSKDGIKVYDLGNVERGKIPVSRLKDIFKGTDKITPSETVIKDGKAVVDVGGHIQPRIYRDGNNIVVENWDIWKYRGKDLIKTHGYNPVARVVGDFIDSRGTPLVHTWKEVHPINYKKLSKIKVN